MMLSIKVHQTLLVMLLVVATKFVLSAETTIEIDEDVINSDYCHAVRKSTKYDPKCFVDPYPEDSLRPFLITGTGRSGTNYAEAALKAAGLKVAHEGIGADGSVAWIYAADVERYPAETTTLLRRSVTPRMRFQTVLHQTRNPLNVIASLTTYHGQTVYRWFIAQHTPEAATDIEDDLLFGLIHWVTWNAMVELTADWRYKLEDFNAELICTHANLPVETCNALQAQTVSKNKNGRRHVEGLKWADLDQLSVEWSNKGKEMAIRYGYTLD